MNNVIITGADGFVGSYTVTKFLNEGKHVLAIDMAASPHRLHPNSNLEYRQCDISDVEQLRYITSDGNYDTFLHLAWAGSAGSGREDYNLQMQNAINTVECLKIAKQIGCSRFVCAGTIMEYELESAMHAQGSQPGMGYIYAMGKLMAHAICKSIAVEIGIDLLWPMITNAYGIGELSPRLINSSLRKIINHEPLQFTSGTQNYDFVYVSDVANAFYLVADKGVPFCEYMIGSGNAKPLKEFLLEMCQACDPEAEAHFGDIPFTGTNMPISTFSIKSISKDCGFIPQVSFSEGTKKTMEWLKTQSL